MLPMWSLWAPLIMYRPPTGQQGPPLAQIVPPLIFKQIPQGPISPYAAVRAQCLSLLGRLEILLLLAEEGELWSKRGCGQERGELMPSQPDKDLTLLGEGLQSWTKPIQPSPFKCPHHEALNHL